METNSVVRALGALAQESRLAVFRLLVEAGPGGLPAGQIAERLGIAPSSLSFHMKELTYANLVTVEQQGRYMIYSANYTSMNDLMAYLTENCCGGNPCSPIGAGSCKPVKEKAS
ncbi:MULTISPECIES: ArsR/SmtB family transcription factor [Burkholderia cepacia complex]|jgi:ArsR family transcriptional regulator|uniref:Metalloregulator ArsR/SmtB family transcription factor n=2 Tax=Burkholderia cenocepacia TaxID=95486 RepID=A0ABD4UT76_9BURK|nr:MULTISPECIES: metalloregulator ArsR/SmtB family transcription factor [Burkholderia cepacia complex]MBU9690843.1 metalloregulator ArsR/SmtB family transcription factor [Burkholderia multivorans]MCW3663590.1 metalloregulator ArsR/SmtB family transcription factor [Burkholderia cenocepacia]MCW3701361.1 metalloregulator ArsR/SmtB family transcription factor [Burkholderia cenocepacia]MCW3704317.1 metalloregulator ArsR/SmtB family transcription factor [Burkholderia cenocepacia]MCW3717371.1 metallo